MDLAKEEYLFTLRDVYMREVMCKVIVRDGLANRANVHESGKIVFLEKNCMWKGALIQLEKEMDIEGQILFVIYKDKSSQGFRVSTVPVEPGSFEFRLGLNEEWRGKNKQLLRQESGIPDMVFCHHSGFIGGADSYESALKMAEISMGKASVVPKKTEEKTTETK